MNSVEQDLVGYRDAAIDCVHLCRLLGEMFRYDREFLSSVAEEAPQDSDIPAAFQRLDQLSGELGKYAASGLPLRIEQANCKDLGPRYQGVKYGDQEYATVHGAVLGIACAYKATGFVLKAQGWRALTDPQASLPPLPPAVPDAAAIEQQLRLETARTLNLITQVPDAGAAERQTENATEDKTQQVFQYVTLRKMAAGLQKSKRLLEKYKQKGHLPPPDVKGGKGKAAEWKWTTVRPVLEKLFARPLPEVFPDFNFVNNDNSHRKPRR